MVAVQEPLSSPIARPFTVGLIGIGGYGEYYVQQLLNDAAERRGLKLVGAVEPFPQRSHRLADFQQRNVPIVNSLEALYQEHSPELIVLASPIAIHAEQTIYALSRGSHVLCEKPLSATVEQGCQMMAARDRAKRIVSIGYQWSFCDTIQRIKQDIRSGRFGRPRRLRTMVLWPRDSRYYSRNSWVGRLCDPNSGAPVFDSPVNNACAHYLHNMLYVLGPTVDRSATPQTVTAELYRANPIENYDTAAIRCMTTEGVELLFIVSHATKASAGPILSYEFEHATIRASGDEPIVATFNDGTVIDYGAPASSVDMSKLLRTVRAINDGTPVECGIEASLPQTQVMAAAQHSANQIVTFAPSQIDTIYGPGEVHRRFVHHLGTELRNCFEAGKLPSEQHLAWAVPAKPVGVTHCPNLGPAV